jgi:peptide chain release factor subunit 1
MVENGANLVTKEELEELIEKLEGIRGRHTELVSVLVPAGHNINTVVDQLEAEKSTAKNIKSTATRKNVIESLEKISRNLKILGRTPKNGIAMYSGNISETEGQTNIELWAIEPPEELGMRLYRCDQTFVLDALKEMLEVKETYGLFVIDRKEATIGLLEGRKVKVLQKLESGVPGKIRAGGQSANRYARIIEGKAKDFFKKCAESLKDNFFDLKNLKGIIIGGPMPTKDDFLKEGGLVTALKDKVIGMKDLGYADEHGIDLLVEASGDILQEQEIIHEKKVLEKFFNTLGKQREKAAYGDEEVETALSRGAVEILYLSKKLAKPKIKELSRKAGEASSSIELISNDTEEGEQFLNLGGVGALLRFALS